jgi:hypothetical protein
MEKNILYLSGDIENTSGTDPRDFAQWSYGRFRVAPRS